MTTRIILSSVTTKTHALQFQKNCMKGDAVYIECLRYIMFINFVKLHVLVEILFHHQILSVDCRFEVGRRFKVEKSDASLTMYKS